MTNSSSPSRFVVQCDWEVCIGSKAETFWAGLKEIGKPGVYCNFFPGSLEKNSSSFAEAEIPSSDPRFSSTYNHEKVSLRIFNPSTNCGTTFIAPSAANGTLHKKSIYSMDVTSGGLGVSADSGGQLLVWETKSFTLRRSLGGHLGDVYSCKFFPSGLVLLSGGADMQLKIWSVETGECVRTFLGHHQAITDVGFIDRGRNVVSCSKDGSVRLWDCGSGDCLATVSVDDGQVNALSIASTERKDPEASSNKSEFEIGTENKLLAVACENGTIAGFSLDDKSKVFQVKCDSAANTCVFNDENTLIGGSDKGCVYTLDIRKPNCFLRVIKEDRGAVWSLCAVDRGYWASFADGSVSYRPIEQTQNDLVCELELSGADCDAVYRVCTDGRFMYTCCRDGKIRKYAVE